MNWLLSIIYWCFPSQRSLGIVALIFSIIGALLATLLVSGLLNSINSWVDKGILLSACFIDSIPAIVDYILLCKTKDK